MTGRNGYNYTPRWVCECPEPNFDGLECIQCRRRPTKERIAALVEGALGAQRPFLATDTARQQLDAPLLRSWVTPS